MKMLKRIFIILLGIIAFLLVVAAFVKKEYTVKREITIHKSRQDVFNYVRLIKNQDHYNKWVMMDPNARKEYKGTDGMVGFVASWDSDNNKVGKGEQEIKGLNEGERIDLDLHFIKPFESKANAWMTTESIADNETRLTWGMSGRNFYPMNIMNLFIDGMLGEDMETSLGNLKSLLEEKN